MSADNKDAQDAANQASFTPLPGFAETARFEPTTPSLVPQVEGGGTLRAWVGKTLGKYTITGVLGQGGMGIVLKAHDPLIQRDVAIKLLAEHLAADTTALQRFLVEARAAGKLNHPNVTAIYEICQERPTCYLVLEYVPGGSWGDRLEQHGACAVLEATQAMIGACKGV